MSELHQERNQQVITAPRISVRTRGPKEWSISVGEQATAEEVRESLRGSGLACGQISRGEIGFVFTANGRRLTANASELSSPGE